MVAEKKGRGSGGGGIKIEDEAENEEEEEEGEEEEEEEDEGSVRREIFATSLRGEVEVKWKEKESVQRNEAETKTRSWRPKHVTAAPAGLGPAADPMATRSPVVVARGCSAACVPSSPGCFAVPCASRAVDAAPGSPATRNWPRMCREDGIRRCWWKSARRPSWLKRARASRKE